MITVLSFVIVFGTLILLHELGHFVTAKLAGVKVLEFGMGFPPKLLSFKRGETTYTLNLLPLGGFVKMMGEEDPTHPRSLAAKPLPIRAIVISAGAFMNGVLAFALFAIVAMIPITTDIGNVNVVNVADDSPAAIAGLLPGDTITHVNGRRIENFGDLQYQYQLRLGATATTKVLRDGEPLAFDLIPRWKKPAGQGPTGIRIEMTDVESISRSKPPWEAIPHAGKRIADTVVLMKNGIASWFIGDSDPLKEVTGPIGIAQVTGEFAKLGIVPLLTLAAVLSLNLALMNILPLPALDGGRLFFIGLEFLRRGKRIPPQKEALVHMAGFIALILLIFAVSYNDILRITRGESILGG